MQSGEWEGRTWADAALKPLDSSNLPRLRVLSYRVCADFRTAFMHYTAHKAWEARSRLLFKEISNYDADVICLQDVDHFQDFWFPKLMSLGYDTVFRQRTQERDFHTEGVLVATRADRLKVFKSAFVSFNACEVDVSRGSAFRECCMTDDVALVLFVRSQPHCPLSTSLCIVCATFSELPTNQDIRVQHAEYLCREIEKLNSDFQLPVLLCANLNDPPSSGAYALLRTGRSPLMAQVPQRPTNVRATPTSRGSAMVQWGAPKLSLADPNINCYRIAWRPGGSTSLGFGSQIEVVAGDCIKYVQREDEQGRKKVVALEDLQFHVTGLVSDLPYEFRVCAVNDVGEGVWSLPSTPVVLPTPANCPELAPLTQFANIEQVFATREAELMNSDDVNVNSVLKMDPTNPSTNLTPRRADGSVNVAVTQGRVLPAQINSRRGWKASLGGQTDPALAAELSREYILSRSILRDSNGFKNKAASEYQHLEVASRFAKQNEFVSEGREDSFLLDGREALSHLGVPNKRHVHSLALRSAYENYGCGAEPLMTFCGPEKAECGDYIFYSSMGLVVDKILTLPHCGSLLRGEFPEEALTINDPFQMEPFACMVNSFDRKLHSAKEKIFSNSVNSSTSSLSSHQSEFKSNVQHFKRYLKEQLKDSHGNIDKNSAQSASFKTNKKAPESGLWGGRWVAFPARNALKSHHFLPHATFPSTHFALGADILFNEDFLVTCQISTADEK